MALKYITRLLPLFSAAALLMGCQSKGIQGILSSNGAGNKLIDPRFYQDEPIAQIINPQNYATIDTTFTLTQASKCHIYGVGEMVVNLAAVPKCYFFKSDDIEIFFKKGKQLQGFVFPWDNPTKKKDTLSYVSNGASYTGIYNVAKKQYLIQVKFPWSALRSLGIDSVNTVSFDCALADNDDGMKQKAKMVWASASDPLYTRHSTGRLSFSASRPAVAGEAVALRSKSGVVKDSAYLKGLVTYQINNLALGHAIAPGDLSGSFKVDRDEQSLNFYFVVNDNSKGIALKKNIVQSPTFSDYGWITDSKGKNVWSMNAYYARPAGGAEKNQQIDTVISLKPGKYKLNYVTDESHAWGNWDASPPTTVFYGIVVYHDK
ncbi:hypothetical protein C8P68_104100 [Mucilaginibacter yixingensis]|uniref:Uncharacterized protein n=1 Tax=Mucilaginibacter yixingensis TaxID=1295612 RepID=A0A2T5J975_9SPHI|nr:hypothetical protein [Mucilaginibacter yixingensis]PTQ96615.1 hypothetical protein C8P68_104100 [Mucilaginibacter yixingensis]